MPQRPQRFDLTFLARSTTVLLLAAALSAIVPLPREWLPLPLLMLCVALLLMVQRQSMLHRDTMATLDELEQSLRTLFPEDDAIDRLSLRRSERDAGAEAQRPERSRLRTIDNLLRRR